MVKLRNKLFRADSYESNSNFIVFAMLAGALFGMGWLALNDVISGMRYTLLFLLGLAGISLSFLFIDENQKEIALKVIKNPFTSDYDVAAGLYVFGWLLPIGISIFFSVFGFNFNISQLMIPLAAEQLNQGVAQSFSVAQAQASPFWQWFTTVYTAGTVEEFVFGFALFVVMVIIAMAVWRLVFKKTDTKSSGALWFYTLFAVITTGLAFGGAHQLNGTYVGIMFLIAIMFRIFMNLGLYAFGLFLSFTIGYHQSNNAVWFWGQYGAQTTIEALTSIGGLIIVFFSLLILLYVFRNIDIIFVKLKKIFTNSS